MALNYMLPIRAVQGVFALVVMVLSCYVANWYDADTVISSPSAVNFLIAVPLFSLGSIIYLELAPRLMPKLSHPYVHLAVEAINTLFYFAGFIALAVFISSLVFCRGSVCGGARAASAFAGFSWLVWTGTLTMATIKLMKGGSTKNEKDKNPMAENPLPPQP